MTGAAKPGTARKTPDAEGGNPAPDASPTPPEPQAAEVRGYVVLVASRTNTTRGSWDELGTVTGHATKADAWKEATEKWPELLPPAPTSAEEAKTQEPVLAKLVPERYFGTIESSVDYVAPKPRAKGI